MKKIALMLMVFMLLTIGAAAVGHAETPVLEREAEVQTFSSAEDVDNDVLFGKYAEQFFTDRKFIIRSIGDGRLQGSTRSVYLALRPMIAEVAEGNRSSTVFEIPFEDVGMKTVFTAEELGVAAIIVDGAFADDALQAARQYLAVDFTAILKLLLANAPYELYWYDKTAGVQYSTGRFSANYDQAQGDYVLEVTGGYSFSFSVAKDYAAGTFMVDSTPVTTAKNAAANAREIVSSYASAGDYEKLLGYKNEICALADYNHSAANDKSTAYGDPWQLIWVFDGDASTRVVCEGYAKAFQYLCDQSSFSDSLINCYSVNGTMSGGTGAGAHMWNLVRMQNGKVYLADVTNCDAGTIGADDLLFLAGYDAGDWAQGYVFQCGGISATYVYNAETTGLYTETELTVSDTDYALDDQTPIGDEDPIDITAENFPDPVFRAYAIALEESYGNGDGTWTSDEISQVEAMNVSNKDIHSLQGIEHFSALVNLECHSNPLTTLDLSGNPALEFLSCRDNSLTVLDLTGNPMLQYVDCGGNQLTELNLIGNASLQHLYCDNNQLTALDLSRNPEMQSLGCNGNQLSVLDVSALSRLEYLDCHTNRLTELDVRNNASLEKLACYGNDISVLDIRANPRIVQYVNDEHYRLLEDDTVRYGDIMNYLGGPFLWCDDTVWIIGGSSVVLDSALDKLVTLNLPGSIREIDDESFVQISMQAVLIPDGCTKIGSKAFADNPQLLYVRIPASVTDIAGDAFDGCPLIRIDYYQ